MKQDKYDEAITYLQKHPEEVKEAWKHPERHLAGCLFDYYGNFDGCLTQIKHGMIYENGQQYPPERFSTIFPSLTEEMKNDDRIPKVEDITVDNLKIFAEYRRKYNELLKQEAEDNL